VAATHHACRTRSGTAARAKRANSRVVGFVAFQHASSSLPSMVGAAVARVANAVVVVRCRTAKATIVIRFKRSLHNSFCLSFHFCNYGDV